MVITDHSVLVRFLVDTKIIRNRLVILPWALYRLPLDVVDRMGFPYEIVPKTVKMRVGTRLAQLITAIGVPQKQTGCCGSCLQLQGTLDAAAPEWIKEHIDELVDEIQNNAKSLHTTVPKKIIKGALLVALLLERRQYRNWKKRMLAS